MSEDIILNDFDRLKNMTDKKFSLHDYLFVTLEDKKLSNDIFFAFLEIFWPSFIQYNGYYFLRENFSTNRFNETSNDQKEFWINYLTLDGFFDKDSENWKEQVIFLLQKLVEIWKLKLKLDFPHLDFTVKYIHDDEYHDYGLTFYQTKLKDI